MKKNILLIILLAILGENDGQGQTPSSAGLDSIMVVEGIHLNGGWQLSHKKIAVPPLPLDHLHTTDTHQEPIVWGTASDNSTDRSTENSPSYPEMFKEDLLLGLGGFTNAFVQPLNWGKQDWLVFGGVAVGTLAMYTVDQQSHDFFVSHKNDVPNVIREIGNAASPERFFLLNGAIYLAGLTTKNAELRETGILLLTSASAASLMLATGKWAFGRARPGTGEGKNAFDPFSTSSSSHSFPSGHSLLSVTTAYAIGKKIKNPWLKAGTYTLGMIAPVSRLWEGAHWLSDVGLSIALGVAVVEGVDAYLNRKNKSESSDYSLDWTFSIGPGALGVKATF